MSYPKQRMVKLQISARGLTDMDLFTKSDPYLSIRRNLNSLTQVRRTETVNNDLNPDWGILYMSVNELCGGDMDMKLQLDVYDDDEGVDDQLIGATQASLRELEAACRSRDMLRLVRKNKNRGDLYVRVCEIDPPSFQERVSSSSPIPVPYMTEQETKVNAAFSAPYAPNQAATPPYPVTVPDSGSYLPYPPLASSNLPYPPSPAAGGWATPPRYPPNGPWI